MGGEVRGGHSEEKKQTTNGKRITER